MKRVTRFADECRGRRSELFRQRLNTPSVGQNVRVSVVRECREGLRAVGSNPALPRVYFVPRSGKLVRVVAELRDDLYELRSELELLRRIRRRLAAPPAPQTSTSPGSRNLDELLQILRDARHAVVDEMTELLDREFPDVREEVAMTVINEEAENIVQEAVDSGVVDAAGVLDAAVAGAAANESHDGAASQDANASVVEGSDSNLHVEPGMTAAETATQIEAALAEAEAALAGVVGVPVAERANSSTAAGAEGEALIETVPAAEVPLAAESAPTTESTPASISNDAGASADTNVVADEACSATTDAGPATESLEALDSALASGSESVDDTSSTTVASEANCAGAAGVPSGSEATSDSSRDAASNSAAAEFVSAQSASAEVAAGAIRDSESVGAPNSATSHSPRDALYTPERAVQAVAEIEQGVRKLATLLSTEVNDQWQRASGTLDELVHAREEAASLAASARASLDAILQLRADAQTARDDAELVRREARELREETRRAKMRAEAAAQAAEIVADQASKERMEFHRSRAMVTQTLP